MKWENRGQSRNVTDNRGRGRGGSVGGGMASLGVGGFLIVLVLSLVFGVDLFSLLGVNSPLSGGGLGADTSTGVTVPGANASDDEMVAFVSSVLDDSQATWAGIFEENGIAYDEAQLVLEDGDVQSACGVVPEAAGPFYCPLNETIYLNFAFYDALQNQYGASGDFAQAYVIAHEMGHHIQNLLGTATDVRQQQQTNPAQANQLSVALELQADCFAGVWGGEQTRAQQSSSRVASITQADFQEGITAAAAIGDDALQERATGRVNPEAFTHGSSEQRVSWFSRGFETGDPSACDTFAAL
ncbi:MAG: YpfJ protein, zinc metalloprotease superfamily [uncultured Truepera sp.]|uniref:YpfJ protein, zinc metalloprotease superfamily n=1 Tax=uncultured Truepera sp. TaxID=543023 RepID=A0A6J4USQ0_9DEIN|nr:MAG: YpfJ protein, zinc metalloprotease superfamily [uncultured Truepera sp.]